MYDKFLFVGLGGSGGKTLRFLKREITHWMSEHGIRNQIPKAWQFLHIDTPVNSDGDEINDLAEPLESDEYLGLIAPGTELRDVQSILDADLSLYAELRTWRVEPAAADVPVQQGAGQMRAIGQTVAMAYAEQIRQRIEQRVARMQGGSSTAELSEIYAQVTGARGASNSNMYVVLVSSLAGGTGAGLLNLVSDIVRALDTPAGDNIFAVLYTPEVFGTLGSAATAGVHPNSLAAVSELLNGYWWQGSEDNAIGVASPRENAVLRRAGLPVPQARGGPKFPLLVGRVGAGGIDFGAPDHLFEMAARSLASWVTPTAENSGFIQYTIGNWNTLAKDGRRQHGVLVDEGDSHEQGLPPMSALGFSRLSVGTSHLARYATQRIAKDVLHHLARYHSDSREASDVRSRLETDDPDAVVRALAATHLTHFLHATQLTELGPEANEIQAGLQPAVHADLVREFGTQARELAALDGEGQRSAEQWRSHLRQAVEQAREQYERKYRRELESATLEWIGRTSRLVVDTVADSVATRGLLVTAEIVSRAQSELSDEVHRELLHDEAPKFRSWSLDIGSAVSVHLGDANGRLRSGDGRLEEAVDEGVHYAQYAGDAMVAEKAAYLCRDLAAGVLAPLHKALMSAHKLAELDLAKIEGWVGWSDERPPADVRPPIGDFPLIDPDDYPRLFSELLADDMGVGTLASEQRDELRRQIVSGRFGAAASVDGQLCIVERNEWFPHADAAVGGSHGPADISVAVSTGLADLQRRTEDWLARPGSRWQRYLGMTIREFVGGDDPEDPRRPDEAELRARRNRFDAQFAAALAAAAPFINLDAGLMGPIHQSKADEAPKLSFSPVPVEAHPAEELVRTRLAAVGIDDRNIGRILSNDASITRVDITGQLAAPVSPLVVESLMRPISERWNQATTDAQRQKFWEWRRAQPLDSFVPAPQALLRCMVRGWYTGKMLGLIEPAGDSFRIHSSRKQCWVPFLPHLLSSPRDAGPRDHLPAVLESLPLAYVEVSRIRSLDPLDSYVALRDLGRCLPKGPLFPYPTLAPALEEWVRCGRYGHDGNPQPDSPLLDQHTGDHDMTLATGRAARIADFCRETMHIYQREFDDAMRECERHPELMSRLPLWTGLWGRQMSPALQDIIDAAQARAQRDPTRQEPQM